MNITITNDFHVTSATFRLSGNRVSRRVVDRVRHSLCAYSGASASRPRTDECTCPMGEFGQRGRQDCEQGEHGIILSDIRIVN